MVVTGIVKPTLHGSQVHFNPAEMLAHNRRWINDSHFARTTYLLEPQMHSIIGVKNFWNEMCDAALLEEDIETQTPNNRPAHGINALFQAECIAEYS